MQKLKLDHYIIGKTLGVGGFGKVKLAKHEFTGCPVAIKMVNKKKVKSKSMSLKIQREIRLLKYFNHPNMIKLYQVLDTDLNIYIVMEYVPGGELFHLVSEQEGLTEKDARRLFRQIISGIEYCHQNLVAHRDLKLENILVDERGNIKIVDFGLSNFMKDGQFLKTGCGSIHYAPPEIILGKPYTGAEVDVWSTGVILYTMLAGFLPFDEDNEILLVKRICSADFSIPQHFSPEAADLLKQMIRVHPLQRIRIVDIKKHPWFTQSEIPSLLMANQAQEFKSHIRVSEPILKRLLKYNMDFQGMDLQEIKDSIICKKNYSFVIAYQLLLDEQKKEQYQIEVLKEELFFGPVTKALESNLREMNQLYNQTLRKPHEGKMKKHWVYGFVYKCSPEKCMSALLKTLAEVGVGVSIKSADYCLKCVVEDKQEAQTEIPAESSAVLPSLIEFTIQVYRIDKTNEAHMIDIKRNSGSSIVFMDYCDRLSRYLDTLLEKTI